MEKCVFCKIPVSPNPVYMRRLTGSVLVRYSLVACSAPSHYLNPCWFTVNWTLTNKPQWNLNRNSNIFLAENASENVCKFSIVFLLFLWLCLIWFPLLSYFSCGRDWYGSHCYPTSVVVVTDMVSIVILLLLWLCLIWFPLLSYFRGRVWYAFHCYPTSVVASDMLSIVILLLLWLWLIWFPLLRYFSCGCVWNDFHCYPTSHVVVSEMISIVILLLMWLCLIWFPLLSYFFCGCNWYGFRC